MKICKNFPSNQLIWYFQNVNKYSFPMILYSTIDIPAYNSKNELAGFALYIHWVYCPPAKLYKIAIIAFCSSSVRYMYYLSHS